MYTTRAVAGAIGVISGLIGIFQPAAEVFAGTNQDSPGSTYRMAIGLDGTKGLNNAGGDMPAVFVWNNNGKYVGGRSRVEKSSPWLWDKNPTPLEWTASNGNVASLHVEHDNQGVHSMFVAGKDAICIAYISATWSQERGGNQFLLVGDIPKACGTAMWYYSGIVMQGLEDSPACFWIDADGDAPQSAFRVRWPAFDPKSFKPDDAATKKDPRQFCNGIDYGHFTRDQIAAGKTLTTYEGFRPPVPKDQWPVKDLEKPEGSVADQVFWSGMNKRSSKRQEGGFMADELVISDKPQHLARELCESPTSLGPSFVNPKEKLFCDMQKRQLHKVCDESTSEGLCFDVGTKVLRDASITARSEVKSPYKIVRDWRVNNVTMSA